MNAVIIIVVAIFLFSIYRLYKTKTKKTKPTPTGKRVSLKTPKERILDRNEIIREKKPIYELKDKSKILKK
jgi:hypothetical protein